MAEPRRSGRSNKGQKVQHQDHVPIKRKRQGKAKAKAQEDDSTENQAVEDHPAHGGEADVIRCACGATVDDESGEEFIQCESCDVWQHRQCMLDSNPVPESYYCEQCRPELHRELLERLEKGEKIRQEEDNVDDRGVEEDEEEVIRKSSMRDVLKAAVLPGTSHNGRSSRTQTKRRKAEPTDSDSDFEVDRNDDLPRAKTRRLSSPADKPKDLPADRRKSSAAPFKTPTASKAKSAPKSVVQLELTNSITDLQDATRKSVAGVFQKALLLSVARAVDDNTIQLGEETKEAYAEKLALGIEHAVFVELGEKEDKGIGQKYRDKSRNLSFNLRDEKNPGLRLKVINNEISPQQIVHMTAEELANQELRQLTDAVRAESTKQSVLRATEGPRIRRTHKGEELVEGEGDQTFKSNDTTTLPSFVADTETKRDDDMSPEAASSRSPVASSPRSPLEAAPMRSVSPPRTGSSASASARKPSSASFDIQNVWNNVHSTANASSTSDKDRIPVKLPSPELVGPADPEIERMFQDENDDDAQTPPYSPTSLAFKASTASSSIWEGNVSMANVGEFECVASFAGGLDLKSSWSEALEPTLHVDGRISIDRATEYLCGQRFSQSRDISAIVFSPKHRSSHEGFDKLFSYFQSRARYGVIRHSLPLVKDAYLVPLEMDQKLPEYLNLVGEHHIPDGSRRHRLLLGMFVVNKVDAASVSPTPTPAHAAITPITPLQQSPPLPAHAVSHHQAPTGQSQESARTQSTSKLDLSRGLPVDEFASAGMSSEQIQLLQEIIAANPEVAENPDMLTNPIILQRLIQEHEMKKSQRAGRR